MTQAARWRIHCAPDDLVEGLFGQLVLWTFELLPLLQREGVVPEWDIRSRLYGVAPDFRVLPGLFEAVHQGSHRPPDKAVSMLALRTRGVSVLGNDWPALHALWHAYFQVPERLQRQADALGLPPGTLGVHYRGNDKNTALLDTNPVSVDDMLALVEEFVGVHAPVPALFIATDEFAFVEAARQRLPGLPIVNLGPVAFHKASGDQAGKADRALLDCLLLSRCVQVLKCSSALSGFAKVLNPALACHRVAASKMFNDVPYFPDAHIPRWAGRSERTRAILQRLFEGDWQDDPRVPARFQRPFASLPRYSAWHGALNAFKYRVSLLRGEVRKA